MSVVESFTTPADAALTEEFLHQGYIVRDVERPEALDAIRHQIVKSACGFLGVKLPQNESDFLNNLHKTVSVEKLNDFRLAVYNDLNAQPWLRSTYFALGKHYIESLAGNELAMQGRVNLSVQMPDDESSLLEIHSDAFSGETPFQIVQWLPLVDVFDTKAMFFLPPDVNRLVFPDIKKTADKLGMDGLFDQVREDLTWINVPYGKVLIFTPNSLHGNVINRVQETRWSLNCRFTGLFTPYTSSEKSLGGFYLPITTRVVSRIGMNYRPPEGFRE